MQKQIKRCKRCKEKFLAKTSTQKYCSVLCALHKDFLLRLPPKRFEYNLKDALEYRFKYLPIRYLKVLKLRFGWETKHPKTLEETGKQLKVTRERIRQMEAKALKILRHPIFSRELRDFM